MANNDGLRRYLEAGAVLGGVTRACAEEIVRELVAAGEVQRDQAQQWVDDFLDRSRQGSESLLGLVKEEVTNQLAALGITSNSIEELTKVVTDLVQRTSQAGKAATSSARSAAKRTAQRGRQATKKSPAKRATAKRATAKRATAKKATAKRATAKKTTAKKATAKKATAKKSTAKKTTAKKTTAKKATAKRATAKKSPAKKSGATTASAPARR